MSTIRITKIFHFEMAHALHGYDGKCAQIHGHSYALSVTAIGTPITDTSNPKLGMVMDFGVLKKLVNEVIVSTLDHALLLSTQSTQLNPESSSLFERVVYVPYQPTCEHMLVDIAEKIRNGLPQEVKLHSLKLVETPSSYAEWFACDN
ncbi:MAG: 6-carboxytetrahydropterin synthase [Flavobacteriales bacterium]|nr:6-carboxytetrahydropterin synthase [Flavobacteriales bacterium]